jgi:hypothetical protein
MRKIIFVSGKYSGNIDENIAYAEEAAHHLFLIGWNVFIPHKNFHLMDTEYAEGSQERTYEFWLDRCLEFLDRCDAIFMLSNYKDSPGALIELDFSLEHEIPVFYQSEGYPEPI